MATETTAAPKEVVVESKSDIPNDTTKEIPVQNLQITEETSNAPKTKPKKQRKVKLPKAERQARHHGGQQPAAKKLPHQEVLENLHGPLAPRNCSTSQPLIRRVPTEAAHVLKRSKQKVYHLYDDGVQETLERLMLDHGRSTHSAFQDPSFNIYLSADRDVAICFKLSFGVAVEYGDPLCAEATIPEAFDGFRKWGRKQGWQVACVGAGEILTKYVSSKHRSWKTIEFGVEQVLNPMKNEVLDGKSGKTILRFNRNLVKDGVTLGLYDASLAPCARLQQDLLEVYGEWREDRRNRNVPEAYTLIFDPFALPKVSRYLYSINKEGKITGFIGLTKIGAKKGYVLDPCIAAPQSPRGTSEFLVTHALAILREEGIDYMTFGLEALPGIGETTGLPSIFTKAMHRSYGKIFDTLGLGGRKFFHDKFKPDDEGKRASKLYLLFPPSLLAPTRLKLVAAVLDVAHISLYDVGKRSIKASRGSSGTGGAKAVAPPPNDGGEKNDNKSDDEKDKEKDKDIETATEKQS